jgi:FlaG/FlaF family flagellin (archaellin)
MKHISTKDEAVSPVVGVMLMLVVTIIIAAVVSAFAGGLAATQEKAPAASFEARISNSGAWGTSTFDLLCLGTDNPIPTKNLKLVTSWMNPTNGIPEQTIITGPGNVPNTIYSPTNIYNSPLGFGPGVNRTMHSGSYYEDQWFGNYTFMAGTRMHNSAYGWNVAYGGYGVSPDTLYRYTDGSTWQSATDTDAMMAILSKNWTALRPGNTVNIKLIHVPSQKVIFDKDVVVEGG